MKGKVTEPNYENLFRSAVGALQNAYNDYKKEVIKNLNCTFYNDEGFYSVLGDQESRLKRIEVLNKQIEQLIHDVEHYRNIYAEQLYKED